MSAWAATTSSAPLRSNCFWPRRSPQAGPPARTALDRTHRPVGHSPGGSTTAPYVERLAFRTEWPHATTGRLAQQGPAARNLAPDGVGRRLTAPIRIRGLGAWPAWLGPTPLNCSGRRDARSPAVIRPGIERAPAPSAGRILSSRSGG